MFLDQVELARAFRKVISFVFDHFLCTNIVRIGPFAEPGIIDF